MVSLLRQMAGNAAFTQSLAVAGETGTLAHEMVGTAAAGPLHRQDRHPDRRGHPRRLLPRRRRAHASPSPFLANALGNPDLGHTLEANMAVALARYSG